VRFIDAQEAASRPETWLGAFRAAIDADCPVSEEALACVRQHAGRFTPDDFFPTPHHRGAMLDFLKPRPGLYARLSEMHGSGVLGQMFPEFKALTCRVVRDFYHKYTVDEHTLLTIRNLERLKDRRRFSQLLNELETPELLVLALLFHDVGKGRDEDHAVESVRLAQRVLDRFQLQQDARNLVEFLIGNHLKMSLVAFRRDTEDPEIVRQFAALVGVETRLKMLCLMTLADIEAVSPDTLTPWKEELLWRLYVDTYNHLTLAYGDEVIDGSRSALSEILAGHPADLAEGEISAFLQGLPRRYLQLFSRDVIYGHVRLARDLPPDALRMSLDRTASGWELTVLTHDRPYLFSNISGVLSSFGMDILRGNAFTSPGGLVLDTFQFRDQERFLELNAEDEHQLLGAIEDAVVGRIDVAARLRGREEGAFRRRSGPPTFPPVIHCDNDSSKRYTIVEVVAEDALGLLYRMSRAMSESGCDVDLVLIATEGRRAIDVFHLTKAGAKLSVDQQLALTANLQRVLEGRHETD